MACHVRTLRIDSNVSGTPARRPHSIVNLPVSILNIQDEVMHPHNIVIIIPGLFPQRPRARPDGTSWTHISIHTSYTKRLRNYSEIIKMRSERPRGFNFERGGGGVYSAVSLYPRGGAEIV